jgi:ribosomal protein S27AE
MKDLIRKVINEMVKDGKVICDNCGWSWDIADGGDDTYSCHKCVTITRQNHNQILID